MLTIRLARRGKRKYPTYRLIISEKTRSTHGSFLELLGSYNPMVHPPTVQLNAERITYWISQGAQTSATVHNLLVSQGVVQGKKRPKGKASAAVKTQPAETAAAPVPQKAAPETKKPEAGTADAPAA